MAASSASVVRSTAATARASVSDTKGMNMAVEGEGKARLGRGSRRQFINVTKIDHPIISPASPDHLLCLNWVLSV